MFNFLFKNRIKSIDGEGYKLYLKAIKAIEADSVQVSVNLLNQGDFDNTNKHLKEVEQAMNVLEEIEQKYTRLKERYKHDGKTLLEIATDWKDINTLHHKLFTHEFKNDENTYKIRSEEILKRFNKLLKA
ncbi:MAG: hypothetical protein WC348_04520 [Patescibacteria group bacterium]